MKHNFEEICLLVCDIAQKAGLYIQGERSGFTSDKIEYKGTQNLVSYVDKTAESMIIDCLLSILPGSDIIAEESAAESRLSSNPSQFTWIIDPLDGTTNFTHGMPPYCVSIALMQGSQVVVGVIYEITCGECFYAWQNSGCYMNGQRVSVSSIDTIERSLVVTGLAYKTQDAIESFGRTFNFFNLNSNGARRLGSAAADLAYVAAGRSECFYQKNLAPWDVAAGAFLVERAGGVVVDYDHGGDYIFGGSIIATNSVAHTIFYDKLTELL